MRLRAHIVGELATSLIVLDGGRSPVWGNANAQYMIIMEFGGLYQICDAERLGTIRSGELWLLVTALQVLQPLARPICRVLLGALACPAIVLRGPVNAEGL